MQQYRKVILFLILMGSLILTSLLFGSKLIVPQEMAYAAETAYASQEQQPEAEHHGAPLIYYVDWLLLIITLALVGYQLKVRLKKPAEQAEEHREAEAQATSAGAAIPVFLIGVVAFIFLTESLSAVAHYHEPVGPGLLRLLIKLTAGVLLMLYGLSFMHEH